MKRFRSSGWLLVIVALILTGCGGEKTQEEAPATTGAPEVPAVEEEAVVPEESPLERLSAAKEKAGEISSMRQLITVEMSYDFDESAFAGDDTGMAAAMMGMMSEIATTYDLRLEGIDFVNPENSRNLKGEGRMEVAFGEEIQEIEIYLSGGRVYTRVPDLGLVYSEMASGEGTVSYDQLSQSSYLLEEVESGDYDVEKVSREIEGQTLSVYRYTFKEGARKIFDQMQSYSDLGSMTGGDSQSPEEVFEFSGTDYALYIDEDHHVVGTEMTMTMAPKDPGAMMGIKGIDFRMDMWILDINETVVTLPDLTGAQEETGIY